ncbi:MAG: PepSY-associated TM helix domain-containing protein [Fidelibacterota bacterium]
MAFKWRKWNNILHRDLGYLAFGLTLIYAISGVAVNHVGDWNPNYKIIQRETTISPRSPGKILSQDEIQDILRELNVSGELNNVYYPSPEEVHLFLEGHTIELHLASGQVYEEFVRERPLLYPMNYLHLNHPKEIWTWMADIYAVVLGILAITGLFILRGPKGITGRGAWLTGLGLLIPLIFLIIYL